MHISAAAAAADRVRAVTHSLMPIVCHLEDVYATTVLHTSRVGQISLGIWKREGGGRVVLLKERRRAETGTRGDSAWREADFLAHLPPYPCIVNLLAHGRHPRWGGNAALMVFEYASRGDLGLLLSRGEHIDCDQKWTIFGSVCAAVRHIHSFGIMHRDIKPSNVFIYENGRIVLGDFGVARRFSEDLPFATSQHGALSLLPPEIARHQPYNESVDIWGLGALAFRLCGASTLYPVGEEREAAIIGKVQTLEHDCGPLWRDVLKMTLCENPAKRQSAAGIMNWLVEHVAPTLNDCDGFLRSIGQNMEEKQRVPPLSWRSSTTVPPSSVSARWLVPQSSARWSESTEQKTPHCPPPHTLVVPWSGAHHQSAQQRKQRWKDGRRAWVVERRVKDPWTPPIRRTSGVRTPRRIMVGATPQPMKTREIVVSQEEGERTQRMWFASPQDHLNALEKRMQRLEQGWRVE